MKTQDSLVDRECTLKNVEVFCSSTGDPYGCTLIFTSVQNNSNKFYIMQVLKDIATIAGNSGCQFYLFTRYGRVNEKGTPSHKPFATSHLAIKAFSSQFSKKTGNVWGPYSEFKPKPNSYYRMEMAQIDVEEEEEHSGGGENGEEENVIKLEPAVKDFIGVISDKNMHMSTLSTFNIDASKMPLGKISDNQINLAYGILSQINTIIESIESGDWAESAKLLGFPEEYAYTQLLEYSNQFWRNVPYSCGRNKPPLINSIEFVNRLTDLLEIIKNAEIAGKIIRKFNNINDIYSGMKISIQVAKDPAEIDIISKFIYQTKGPTHNYNIQILEIFRLDKEVSPSSNSAKFFDDLPNHRLLVHGSRTANFMGILSSGLRLPHPDQVANGSVLGRGIYFADVITKSFNYCSVETTGGVGFVILCEVALGDNPDLREYPGQEPLRPGQTSRHALGKTSVCENSLATLTTADGFIKNVKVPQKLETRRGLSLAASFLYNEFVVFDTRQYRFKYLIKLKKV